MLRPNVERKKMAEKFERATFTRNFLKTITRIKNPDEMLAEAKSEGLEKLLESGI